MKNFLDTQELREALVDLMKIQGINQIEVSRQSGVRQSVMSLFISGKRSLNGDSALKIENFIRASHPPPQPPTRPPSAEVLG